MNKCGIKKSLSQDILQYLMDQEQYLCCGEDVGPKSSGMGLTRVRSILDDVIRNVSDRAEYIEQYYAKLLVHNQFPLFDFSTIVPGFYIDDDLYEKISFREHLVVSYLPCNSDKLVPIPVGGLCQDIQLAKGQNPLLRKGPAIEQRVMELITRRMNIKNNPPIIRTDSEQQIYDYESSLYPKYEQNNMKFLVHLSSKFNARNNVAGSRITAWVDRNLHTLEEKRTEFIMEGGVSNEKSLYCALQPRRYYVKHKSTLEGIDDRKFYSMQKARDLICEGSNIVLMRYLAIIRFIGTFELSTMYINGDMCRNIYECTGPESGIVNEEKLDLCKIYRTIIEECGLVHKCVTVLTLSGQLVKQEWDSCDYILQVNPLARISNDKPLGNESLILSKVWEKDMQLFSNYLDFKTTGAMKLKSYLIDHPEFKNMMADYVQATLLMKPEQIMDYTIKHFKSYAPRESKKSKVSYLEEEDYKVYT